MTTSANVVEYKITLEDEVVGTHRQHCLCKTHWDELCKFTPLNKHKIQAFGYDEEEAYGENDSENLEDFLFNLIEARGIKLEVEAGTLRWVNLRNGKKSKNVWAKARAIILFHRGDVTFS